MVGIFAAIFCNTSKKTHTHTLTYFINEVGSFDRPATGDIVALDLNLLRQDMVTNLFPTLSNIWSLTNKDTPRSANQIDKL